MGDVRATGNLGILDVALRAGGGFADGNILTALRSALTGNPWRPPIPAPT